MHLESLSCPLKLPANFNFICTYFRTSNVLIALSKLLPYTFHTKASLVQWPMPSCAARAVPVSLMNQCCQWLTVRDGSAVKAFKSPSWVFLGADQEFPFNGHTDFSGSLLVALSVPVQQTSTCVHAGCQVSQKA